jgi:probable rRNA maturation factor
MITILFQTESHFPVDRKKVKAAITTALSGTIKSDCEVSVSIIGDRRMKSLNNKYRQKDHTTDVLSFPLYESSVSPNTQFIEPPDGTLRLGDIVVSFPMAVKEAGEENKMVDDKIVELVLHGLDHLLGKHHPE